MRTLARCVLLLGLVVIVPRVAWKNGRSVVTAVDARGRVLARRAFAGRVRVIRQDVNGDGILDLVIRDGTTRKKRGVIFGVNDS